VGRLLTGNGEPVALVSGLATELAAPEREAVPFFTNREGRFGLTGLAPGRWRLTLPQVGAVYEVEIPDEEMAVRLGELTPTAPARPD